MDKFGLIGEKLGHSYSKQIHEMLGGYEYGMYELEPEMLGSFLEGKTLSGMNVTIPYKKAVIPYCGELSDTARRIGSVNTMVLKNGVYVGHNTDYCGFAYSVARCGVDAAGKKALVFGGGGVTPTVCAVLSDLGCREVVVVSRKGAVTYSDLDAHRDAEILVNATPVGMYPKNGQSVVAAADFPRCEAVLDLVYNPFRTALLLEAERLGIPHENGLAMLAHQAVRAWEIFTDKTAPDGATEDITSRLQRQMENVILIGMPGCGKTGAGRRLAGRLGREFVDADDELVKSDGKSIPEIFAEGGEELFRRLETETLKRLCSRSGLVIATGGGCVTKRENYDILHQNGKIVWIKRDLGALPSDGRPLSQKYAAEELYARRRDSYAAFADAAVENSGSFAELIDKILEAIK